MSPFSELLYQLRCRYDVRQTELAERVGYEQSYISALEIGSKGPPTEEFIERLEVALALTPLEREHLRQAAQVSNRKFVLEADAPQDHFLLLDDLRRELTHASPGQIRMIRDILRLRDASASQAQTVPRRIRRRRAVKEMSPTAI
jgi:transcriptional regulator with XRE-family HTH domain